MIIDYNFAWDIARFNIISSDPPAIADALTPRYIASIIANLPPIVTDLPPSI